MKRRAFIRRLIGSFLAYGLLSWDLDDDGATRMVPAREWTKMYPTPFQQSYLKARRVKMHEMARMFDIPPEMLDRLAEDLAQFPNPPVGELIRAFR